MPDSLDLLAVTRFRNLPLHNLVPRGTGMVLAKKVGISYQALSGLLNLSKSPFKKLKGVGEYTDAAIKLATYFQVAPEDLFPRSLYELKLPTEVQRAFRSAEIMPMLEARRQHLLPVSTDETQTASVQHWELAEQLNEILETLTPRQQKVIEMRFGLDGEGEHTLREVGKHFSVTAERIREIESKALGKLRHPSRLKKLRPFTEAGEYK